MSGLRAGHVWEISLEPGLGAGYAWLTWDRAERPGIFRLGPG
jgi:hypothetical protein